MRNNVCLIAYLTFLIGLPKIVQTEPLPHGISFVGLDKTEWALYTNVLHESKLTKVPTFSEPRTPTVNQIIKMVVYIGADASVNEFSLNDGKSKAILEVKKGRAYTQPNFDHQGNRLFVVSLKEGASVDTDILVRQNDKWKIAIKQSSAQFEPFFHPPNFLYYSNVHCA
jgi:hypothetical protein